MKDYTKTMVSRLVNAEHHKAMVKAMKETGIIRIESDSADTLKGFINNRKTGESSLVYYGLCKAPNGRGNWIVRYPIELFSINS